MTDKIIAQTHTTPVVQEGAACLIEGDLRPCTIVIFGASGDLTRRKLIPALFCLHKYGALPTPCTILGCSRTRMTSEEFRDKMEQAVINSPHYSPGHWKDFSVLLHYTPIEYESQHSFRDLSGRLQKLESQANWYGRLFYYAVPPSLYIPLTEMLGKAGLLSEQGGRERWTRVVVEKPFGRDLASARKLDHILHQYLEERQIFRIDHYLAKETVQNILMFRFANSVFEPIWNRRYIESIKIIAAESIGVEHRAAYYEETGVLRDMFQNHMMQLLALTSMEPPSQFEADRVRDEKVKVYRSLRPFPVGDLRSYLVVGQYVRGKVDGKEVPGYREEPGVAPNSLTPTFASMKVFVDNWRWQGVPFFLTSGKRLKEKRTEIVVRFKKVPHSMFRNVLAEEIMANRLSLGIYPDEKITLTFQTKRPGAKVCLRSVTMDFHYHQDYEGPVLEAYEKVLLDCILGDQMLFWRQDGVELCWGFLTPIVQECETCGERAEMLIPYPAGSWGPPEAAHTLDLA